MFSWTELQESLGFSPDPILGLWEPQGLQKGFDLGHFSLFSIPVWNLGLEFALILREGNFFPGEGRAVISGVWGRILGF